MYQVPEDKIVYAAEAILSRCDPLVTTRFHMGHPLMEALLDVAHSKKIHVYLWEEDHVALSMPLHTEKISPIQIATFMDTIMSMYRTLLYRSDSWGI
jgi:hypothetical protein